MPAPEIPHIDYVCPYDGCRRICGIPLRASLTAAVSPIAGSGGAPKCDVLLAPKSRQWVGRELGTAGTHTAPDQAQRVRFRNWGYRNRAQPLGSTVGHSATTAELRAELPSRVDEMAIRGRPLPTGRGGRPPVRSGRIPSLRRQGSSSRFESALGGADRPRARSVEGCTVSPWERSCVRRPDRGCHGGGTSHDPPSPRSSWPHRSQSRKHHACWRRPAGLPASCRWSSAWSMHTVKTPSGSVPRSIRSCGRSSCRHNWASARAIPPTR